jgi:hypothetical protein
VTAARPASPLAGAFCFERRLYCVVESNGHIRVRAAIRKLSVNVLPAAVATARRSVDVSTFICCGDSLIEHIHGGCSRLVADASTRMLGALLRLTSAHRCRNCNHGSRGQRPQMPPESSASCHGTFFWRPKIGRHAARGKAFHTELMGERYQRIAGAPPSPFRSWSGCVNPSGVGTKHRHPGRGESGRSGGRRSRVGRQRQVDLAGSARPLERNGEGVDGAPQTGSTQRFLILGTATPQRRATLSPFRSPKRVATSTATLRRRARLSFVTAPSISVSKRANASSSGWRSRKP